MILEKVAVRRYTDAFFKYASETIGVQKALEDISLVKDVMRDNPDFQKFLENPEMCHLDKIKMIDAVLKDISEEIRFLLRLLLEHRRIEYFPEIAEYAFLNYAHEGREDCVIKTTFPLDLDLIKKIEDRIEQKFKRKFKYFIYMDSSLLGGIEIIIGNKVIDGSVRRRLEDLKEKLMSLRVA